MRSYKVGDVVKMKSLEEIVELEKSKLSRSSEYNRWCDAEGVVVRLGTEDRSFHVRMKKVNADGIIVEKIFQDIKCIRFVLVKGAEEALKDKAALVYENIHKYISEYGPEFKMPGEEHCSREILIKMIMEMVKD